MKTLTLKCPLCNLPARADLKTKYHKFLVYICPRCQSNVAFFDNKTRIISDNLLKRLHLNKKLKFCGDVSFKTQRFRVQKRNVISEEDIANLREFLATENDSGRIISRL